MQKFPNPAQSLYNLLHEETWTEWSEQEIENPPVTLEAATSLTTPQNSTIIPEGVTNLTTPNHSVTTETENKEEGISSIITAKTDNITSPGGLAVAFPVSSTLPFPQSPDKVRSCSSGEHVPERLRDKDECWSSHGKSPGHSGQTGSTCLLFGSLHPLGKEEGYRTGKERNNRNNRSSTMGRQNTIITIPRNNCCTLCELRPTETDPKQHLPEPGNSSKRQESWAIPKNPPGNYQTPSDPRPLFHWDTRWTNGPVTRKELVNGRKNKENLPNSGNPNAMIETWTHLPTSPRLSLGYQLNKEPGNTEKGNRTECSKTPSVSQASLGTVRVLEVATVMIKIQVLFWDKGVPAPIGWRILRIDKNVCKIESSKSEKSSRAVESPQNTSRPVQTEVSQEHTGYRDKTYHWIEPTRATGSLKSSPNSQTNMKPDGTEGGSRAVNSKAPSVPPGTPTTVRVLDIAIIATRCQALSRDLGVPISIDRAVGSPLGNSFGNPQTVRINVSNDLARNSDKNEETYWEKRKAIRATSAQRNRYQIAKTQVSDIRKQGGTYQMAEQWNRGRPPEGQSPDQESRIDRASKPGEANGNQTVNTDYDHGRPPEGQNSQQNQNPPRVCKFERAYKPATDQRNETEKVIGPMGYDPPEETESGPVTEGISYDRDREKTYLEVSRLGNRDSGGPWKDQELRGKMGTHRAHKPDGRLKNKNAKTREETNETHREMAGRHKEETCGGEPRSRTRLNWPTSRGNKNKVPPVYRYAMRLAEPQYGWQSRNAIGDGVVRLTLSLAATTNLTNQNQPTSTTPGKLKFRQCVTNNVSCYSN